MVYNKHGGNKSLVEVYWDVKGIPFISLVFTSYMIRPPEMFAIDSTSTCI